MSLGLGTAWGLLWGEGCWVELVEGGEMTVWRWEVKVDMSTWRRRVEGVVVGLMLCSTEGGGVSLLVFSVGSY